MKSTHVVIAGAGPVGLVAALILAQEGVRVTVLEAAPHLNMDLRASTFHPPTLDMLARFGLTEELVAQGLVARHTQQRDRTEGLVAEFDMQLLAGDTDHPFRLQCEQWKLAEGIKRRLDAMPHVTMRFSTRLEVLAERDDGVDVDIVTDGAADIAWHVMSYTPGRFDDCEVVGLPFVTRNATEASVALHRLYSQGMLGGFDGLHMLALAATPPVVIHGNKAVRTPADLKGKRVRVSGDHLTRVVEALGEGSVPR